MAWRIVQQPNGLLARFSDVVGHFTDYDMTHAEAIDCCLEYLGRRDAPQKVQRGIDAGNARWGECLAIMRRVHGAAEVTTFVDSMEKSGKE